MTENSKPFPLTQDEVRELIDYDPETGICRWKVRDVKWFHSSVSDKRRLANCNDWNNRFAGEEVKSFTHYKNRDKHQQYRRFFFSLNGNSNEFLLHSVIWFYMTGEWPLLIDHINGNSLDNSWINLRNTNTQNNAKNVKLNTKNKSGVTGVCFSKSKQKWRSYIYVSSKCIELGYFKEFNQAVFIRKAAEKQYGFHKNHGRIV